MWFHYIFTSNILLNKPHLVSVPKIVEITYLCREYIGKKSPTRWGLICAEILPLHDLPLSPLE